jgi:hypothetical protein
MAESLAFADTNFNADEPEDQEVFRISIHHRFFTFWCGIFSKEYLAKIRKTPVELGVCFVICIIGDCPKTVFLDRMTCFLGQIFLNNT